MSDKKNLKYNKITLKCIYNTIKWLKLLANVHNFIVVIIP